MPLFRPPVPPLEPSFAKVANRRRRPDTSCMSPSCKRGFTRLTSIVLADGHACIARRIDGQAMIKSPRAVIEMGTHSVTRPVFQDTIGCLAITRGLTFDCAISDWTGRATHRVLILRYPFPLAEETVEVSLASGTFLFSFLSLFI